MDENKTEGTEEEAQTGEAKVETEEATPEAPVEGGEEKKEDE